VSEQPEAEARGWRAALRLYTQRRMLTMLFLGFSAGLPFYLVFQSLSAWLRQAHIERSTIGMLAWVGTMYSLKFLWAPIVDRVPIPPLTRLLGRRLDVVPPSRLHGIRVGQTCADSEFHPQSRKFAGGG